MFGLRRWIADNGGAQRDGASRALRVPAGQAYGRPWTPRHADRRSAAISSDATRTTPHEESPRRSPTPSLLPRPTGALAAARGANPRAHNERIPPGFHPRNLDKRHRSSRTIVLPEPTREYQTERAASNNDTLASNQ